MFKIDVTAKAPVYIGRVGGLITHAKKLKYRMFVALRLDSPLLLKNDKGKYICSPCKCESQNKMHAGTNARLQEHRLSSTPSDSKLIS